MLCSSKNSPARDQHEASLLLADFLLGLLFVPDDEGDMFLGNFGIYLNCMALQPRKLHCL
jgi:hypothetical protein